MEFCIVIGLPDHPSAGLKQFRDPLSTDDSKNFLQNLFKAGLGEVQRRNLVEKKYVNSYLHIVIY